MLCLRVHAARSSEVGDCADLTAVAVHLGVGTVVLFGSIPASTSVCNRLLGAET